MNRELYKPEDGTAVLDMPAVVPTRESVDAQPKYSAVVVQTARDRNYDIMRAGYEVDEAMSEKLPKDVVCVKNINYNRRVLPRD